MASVTFTNIAKTWSNVVGVADLSLHVADGEFLVLLGPSGCGKTTTMRMVAGLEQPSQGEIRIDDRVINDVPTRSRNVAMVFQNYGLYPHMSVAENIGYPLRIRGMPRAERDSRIQKVAQQVELTDFLLRKPRELSGGQRQRVALARAMIREPAVFLMDEPLSNLDAKLRVTMRAELKHMQHELRATTIYVTHDQIEAMTLADRVVVMNRGSIEQVDTPTNIYDDPATMFVAGFVGSPAMNLVPGALVDGDFVGADGLTVPGAGSDNRANFCIGFRPEDLQLAEPGTGHIRSSVFSVEMTGESSLVTFRVGETLISARVERQFTASIGAPIEMTVSCGHRYLFDQRTSKRVN